MTLTECKVLFWSDESRFLTPTWRSDDRILEIELEYESKLAWNPLNQNPLNRDYKSVIHLHEAENGRITRTEELSEYQGWTLEGSLYSTDDYVYAIRGTSDVLGDLNREVVVVRYFPPGQVPADNPPLYSLRPEQANEAAIAAIPAPGSPALLALLSTAATLDNPNGEVRFNFFRVETDRAGLLGSSVALWPGAPGIPELAWKSDRSGIYMRRRNDVLFIPVGGEPREATTFPSCFIATDSGEVSRSGRRMLRSYDPETEESTFRFENTGNRIPFGEAAMIADPNRIGQGCEQSASEE